MLHQQESTEHMGAKAGTVGTRGGMALWDRGLRVCSGRGLVQGPDVAFKLPGVTPSMHSEQADPGELCAMYTHRRHIVEWTQDD